MDQDIKKKLQEIGVDLNTAMERFLGNEALLLRFLKKFKQDPNYEDFKAAMKEKRYEDAFKATHTLKGLCGNLSLTALYDITSKEVELLRHGEYSAAEEFYPEVVQQYDKVLEILETLS